MDTASSAVKQLPHLPYTWPAVLPAFHHYLRACGDSPDTIELRTRHLMWWSRVCREPGRATLQALEAFMGRETWAPETRRSVRSSLRVFYAWTARQGITDGDPSQHLPKVRVPMAEPRPAPDDAVRAAMAKANDRQMFMLLLGSVAGLRRKEIAQVHTADLELLRDYAELRVKGKGGRERVVTLPLALARRIQRQPEGWLFPNGQGSHLSSAHVGVLLRRILPTGVTPHMLRHACATALHDEGATILELRRFLGHASAATTQRYVYIRPNRIAGLANSAAARFIA